MPSAAKMLSVNFVQCRGTPYEVGRAQADALAVTRKGKAFLRKKAQLPPLVQPSQRGARVQGLRSRPLGGDRWDRGAAQYPDGAGGPLFW
jgi:hypothetical protein